VSECEEGHDAQCDVANDVEEYAGFGGWLNFVDARRGDAASATDDAEYEGDRDTKLGCVEVQCAERHSGALID